MGSKKKFKSLYDIQKYFSSEDKCRKYLEKMRWNNKPVCPRCSSDNIYKTNRGYKCANKQCKMQFTVTCGTVFENSKIPLSKWFTAMYLITSHTKGISSIQLAKDVGITQKSAWFLNHRIRELLRAKTTIVLSNIVEADETYVGGKARNKHESRKRKNQVKDESTVSEKRKQPIRTYTDDKAVVLGILERQGNIVVKHIPNNKKETIDPIVRKHVQPGSTVSTDEWYGYNALPDRYKHITVSHGKKIYVDGMAHTNNIEGFWSLLKRGIYGIYHSVSEKHLNRYLDEFSARFNTRKIKDAERFNKALTQCNGRLKYNSLIGKK